MANNRELNKYVHVLTDHLRKNISVLIWVSVFCLLGIVVGLALLFGEKSYLSLLTTNNQTLLGYISGSATTLGLFWSRLFSCLLAMLIIFLLCLNYYSAFVCFIYFAYQSAITTIVCGTLISYQGFAGILNVVLLILPANLILLAILGLSFSIFFSRAKQQYKYKIAFGYSFSQNHYWGLLLFCLILLLALNILYSLLIPLVIKGIYLIYY